MGKRVSGRWRTSIFWAVVAYLGGLEMKRKCKGCVVTSEGYESAINLEIDGQLFHFECLCCKYFKRVDMSRYAIVKQPPGYVRRKEVLG